MFSKIYFTGKNAVVQTGFVADTVYGDIVTAIFLRKSAEATNEFKPSCDGISRFAKACHLTVWSKGNQLSTIPSIMCLQYKCDRKTYSIFENGHTYHPPSHGIFT